MQIGDVVHSEPLSELEIEMSPEHIRVCEVWLHLLGCRITPTQGERYLIGFPEGTQETIRCGLSGAYTRRTAIAFPSGMVLPKYVAYPINKKQRGKRVTMGFPTDLSVPRLQGTLTSAPEPSSSGFKPISRDCLTFLKRTKDKE